MFERFTDRARAALVAAQTESMEQRHGFLGTEHLLMGLVRIGDGIAHAVLDEHGVQLEPLREKVHARLAPLIDPGRLAVSPADALASIGIDLGAVRASIEASFGEGALPDPGSEPPAFTPKAKTALEEGLRRALLLRHRYIGTEHVLLGLLRDREAVGPQALLDLGVDLDALDAAVVERAAPDATRLDKAWDAVQALLQEIQRLPEAERERARPIASALALAHGTAIGAEQEQVNRLTRETAGKLEEAIASARAELAAL